MSVRRPEFGRSCYPAPAHGLFVTGTDTEVGKTYVASLIARVLCSLGHRVGVYKPVASGCRRVGHQLISDDAVALWEAAGRPGQFSDVCPQRFQAPTAPHVAARAEGKQLDSTELRSGLARWQNCCDVVIVEGAGGLMSPVGEDEYVADLACDIGYPLVVVAANVLGVINQTLQTLITAATFRGGMDVAGVVLNDLRPNPNDASQASNYDELTKHCDVPLLTHVRWGETTLRGDVDWMSLARAPGQDNAV